MQVEISLRDSHKLAHLVELLKSLNYVDSVKIQPDSKEAIKPATNQSSIFDRFYGSTKSGLTVEQLDERLSTLRDEWERTI
jgi:uncharacterized small protein (DUF1192 family)